MRYGPGHPARRWSRCAGLFGGLMALKMINDRLLRNVTELKIDIHLALEAVIGALSLRVG